MRILVTGGAGFIGSHVVVELLENDYEIIIADNFSNSHEECIQRMKRIAGKDFPVCRVDLMDMKALEGIFDKWEIDSVIHLAGLKSVEESVVSPLMYYRNNINGLLNLCEVMSMYGVKKLVFSSTAAVYGNILKVPIDESSPLSSINPYGETKLVAERILQDLYFSDPEWSIVNLRYFNPIGAHQSGLIGEDPSGTPNNLMPYLLQVALGKKESMQIYGNDYGTNDGTAIRDYIHVTDLAKGHVKAIEYLFDNKGVETFNLGTGRGYSVIELINVFSQVSGIEIPYQIVGRRPKDISVSYANPAKANVKLGWKSEKSIVDMCRDVWNWQCANPEGYNGKMVLNTVVIQRTVPNTTAV